MNVKKNLERTLDFSDELKEQFSKNIKIFINIFVKSIPNYNFSLYGNEKDIIIEKNELEALYNHHSLSNKTTISLMDDKAEK